MILLLKLIIRTWISHKVCLIYSTKLGMYRENCGLDNVLMSWGHDGENKREDPFCWLVFLSLYLWDALSWVLRKKGKEDKSFDMFVVNLQYFHKHLSADKWFTGCIRTMDFLEFTVKADIFRVIYFATVVLPKIWICVCCIWCLKTWT